MRLCLGTVQFGLPYGVVDRSQVPMQQALACLNYAVEHGVTVIDTAAAYGNAEEVVAEFLADCSTPREELTLSTKLMPNVLDDVVSGSLETIIRDLARSSLERLGTSYIDEYFLHSSRYAFNQNILEALQVAKEAGLVRKVGVSVYDPDEALACFESGFVDVIQAPYSVLDHRMKDAGVFERAAKAGCEVHIRSAFVKGLALMDEGDVPAHLETARPIIAKFSEMSAETGFSRIELALAYIKRETAVSRIVIGVHSLAQLIQDIEAFEAGVPDEVLNQMDAEFEGIPAEVVIPSLWKK